MLVYPTSYHLVVHNHVDSSSWLIAHTGKYCFKIINAKIKNVKKYLILFILVDSGDYC